MPGIEIRNNSYFCPLANQKLSVNKFIALVVVSCCLLGCAGNFARLNGDDKYDIPQADMRVSVTSTVAQPSGYDPTEVITDAPVISNPLVPSATVT